jgi:uncharacterized protein (TIGR03643 family)
MGKSILKSYTMEPVFDNYCYCSDLPSPRAYIEDDMVVCEVKAEGLTEMEIDRIIEMAWEDRTPFDAITYQFGLKESKVRELMKRRLRFKSYRAWRKRVEACNTKHSKKRPEEITRFRCSRQRTISLNKISKRY